MKEDGTEQELAISSEITHLSLCDAPESDSTERFRQSQGRRLSLTLKLKPLSHKTKVALGQMCGSLKRPKCTYKTSKRDCAKRNK